MQEKKWSTRDLKSVLLGLFALLMIAVGSQTVKATNDLGTNKASILSKPTNIKITASKQNRIVITWKKVSSATGYCIYRSKSKNGTYKKIKTLKSVARYTDKVASGKTYYYKIKAYKKKGNNITYSYATAARKGTEIGATWDSVKIFSQIHLPLGSR